MVFYVPDDDEWYDSAEDVAEKYIDESDFSCHDDEFYDWIDNEYSGVSIGGNFYLASEIISNANDEWRLEKEYISDRVEDARDNAIWDLKHTDIGDYTEVNGVRVEVYEEKEKPKEKDFTEDSVDYLAATRKFIDEQNTITLNQQQEDKKKDKEMKQMFQVIA